MPHSFGSYLIYLFLHALFRIRNLIDLDKSIFEYDSVKKLN